MLVLSAAFQDGVLKQMIDEERFKYLLERTRSFLRRWTPTSTTCAFECGIVESIQRAFSKRKRRTIDSFNRRRNDEGDVASIHPFKEVSNGSI